VNAHLKVACVVAGMIAGRILAEAGEIRRFPSRDHFATYIGTAPLDVSSGGQVRHRLSRSGNRRINHAIHPAEHDVHEEALGLVFRLRQVAVLEVGGDHTPVVRPVPGPSGRVIGEGHPEVNRLRGGRPGKVPAQGHRLTAVTKDALVHRTPPWTTRMVAGQWLQQTSPELPSHERHRRPAERQMPRGLAVRAVAAALHQGDPACRIVADRGDLPLSLGSGRTPRPHVNMIARATKAGLG